MDMEAIIFALTAVKQPNGLWTPQTDLTYSHQNGSTAIATSPLRRQSWNSSFVTSAMDILGWTVIPMSDATERFVHHGDAAEHYDEWDAPAVIISDGAYGVQNNTFEGDPNDPQELAEWYRPHIESWTEHATPSTTLWFWCSDIGWAKVHPVLESNGWEYQGVNVWGKGMEHIAGNCNTGTLRKFPQVTELCVQYTRPAYGVDNAQSYLRSEWERAGLPFSEANGAAGVDDAATRRWLTPDDLFYPPPQDSMRELIEYANENGDPDGRPYFDEIVLERPTFDCPAGVTNVWREGHTAANERAMEADGATHPNQKPLALMRRLVDVSSDRGDVVWEPFGGLCTASVAAVQLDRRPFAAEMKGGYVDQARDRIRNAPSTDEIGQQQIVNFVTDGGQTFLCSQCGHEEVSGSEPVLGGNECPECGCGMTLVAATDDRNPRSVDTDTDRSGGGGRE